MKRIFLTSGLVLCMACPAFATNTFSETTGTLQGECDYGALETYTGPTQLQAIWDANQYTLTYQPGTPASSNGNTNTVTGMPETLAQTVTYDGDHTVANDPSLTGYTFNGWLASDALGTSSPAATGNLYPGGASIAAYKGVGAQTMTAQWTANQYDVKYSDGTSIYTHTDGATYDTNYTALGIGDTTLTTPSGYTFIGWSASTNPTVTRSAANGTTPVNTGTVDGGAWTGETPWRIANDNKTVYAAFLANQYNITYSCTGGEPSGNTGNNTGTATGTPPATQLVTFDSAYTLAANTCTLQGYVFNGWDCPNLVGTTQNTDNYFTPGSQGNYAYAGSVTCTAKWKAGTITDIQWDLGGGTASTAGATQCTYDGEIALPTNPQKTGYTFGGWEVVGHSPSGN